MKPASLLEPMDMPDPSFPVKVHRCLYRAFGQTLFPNHWHPHIELLYIVRGTAIVECNGVPHPVGPGQLIYVNGNDLHAGVSTCDDLFYYALIFDPILLQSRSMDAIETRYMFPLVHNGIVFANQVEHPSRFSGLFLAIVQELEEKAPGYELAVKAELYHLLVALFRESPVQARSARDSQSRMRQLERLTPVLSHIEEHVREELTVERLAALAGLSRYHFSRLFKQLTDRSVTDYVNDIRIRHAEYLLHNTQKTISDIALDVGYRDIYYFSRMFKKRRGIAPSAVRL